MQFYSDNIETFFYKKSKQCVSGNDNCISVKLFQDSRNLRITAFCFRQQGTSLAFWFNENDETI